MQEKITEFLNLTYG